MMLAGTEGERRQDDYEYVLTIPPEGVRPLLIALLRDAHSGQHDAVPLSTPSQLRSYWTEKEIPQRLLVLVGSSQ